MKGTVHITFPSGDQVTIPDVLYVPKLAANLLSIGQLQNQGIYSKMTDDSMMFHKGLDGREIGHAVNNNNNQIVLCSLKAPA